MTWNNITLHTYHILQYITYTKFIMTLWVVYIIQDSNESDVERRKAPKSAGNGKLGNN